MSLGLPPQRKVSQNVTSEYDLGRTISRNLSTSVSTTTFSDWKVVMSDAVAVISEKGEAFRLKREVLYALNFFCI